ncbi:MAG: DUF5717 family protein [Clostridiales bacterium]|jgi:hypothetical protein|nr:DUF5717 family protein [Clostridiales bacterium]
MENFAEALELPPPKLLVENAGQTGLIIEAAGAASGSLTVKNAGGGRLFGRVESNARWLSFNPPRFEGARASIAYTADLSGFKPGDTARTTAVITSSGGEAVIPVLARAAPFALTPPGGEAPIAGLREFYKYARREPAAAEALFFSAEFEEFLRKTDYPRISSYIEIIKDSGEPERAMDNFFILNGLKKRAKISPEEESVTSEVNPYSGEAVSGRLVFSRSAQGYISEEITAGSAWLELHKTRLTSGDFDEKGKAAVPYVIYTEKIPEGESFCVVKAGPAETRVYLRKLPPFSLKMPKEVFSVNEKGYILLENNAGKEILIEVSSSDPCLRFESSRFSAVAGAKIPFVVKPTATQLAQFVFRQRPFIPAVITVNVPNFRKSARFEVRVAP